MRGRQNADRDAARPRGIAGPTSALTDYLAANNISAAEIARNHSRRQQAALADAVAVDAAANDPPAERRNASSSTPSQSGPLPNALTNASSVVALADKVLPAVYNKKLTRAEQKSIEHYKTTDDFERARRLYKGKVDDEDTLARMFYFTAKKTTGQLENCASCGKRFTVTAYTIADADGGLLCPACAKDVAAKQPPKKKLKTSGGPVGKRRGQQSRILDGTAPIGARSLVEICIEHLSKHIELADDLGVLPEHVVDRIARILSKRRKFNAKVLPLFTRPETRILRIYDCAALGSQDMIGFLQVLSNLKSLKLRHAIQFKDEVMEYLLARPINLEVLSLRGSNLISTGVWERFFAQKGASLKTFQVYCQAQYFKDDVVEKMVQCCPNLTRVKLVDNIELSGASLPHLEQLTQLQHLSLKLWKQAANPAYVSLLDTVGSKLQTLSFRRVVDLNDTVLQAIHRNCRSLSKLRITDSENLTNDAFVRLFTDWQNPRLRHISFSKCRLTNTRNGNGQENDQNIGLCDKGFEALMEHSGRKLQHLDIESCRHISDQGFRNVFSPDKKYPDLETLDISFCESVNDFIVGSIFRSCPALKWIKVFGCMKVRDVLVPRGRILIGVPNAIGMHIEGFHD